MLNGRRINIIDSQRDLKIQGIIDGLVFALKSLREEAESAMRHADYRFLSISDMSKSVDLSIHCAKRDWKDIKDG